ncbi:hypothetical protein [Acetobacter pomorum]|uniref:hypothetical protein n=1 Tax=Acetobacter pomorum TaxID=65959 RepID=UPI001F080EF9|nr:hypothetical protein [Acetobacter pomorum]
MSGKLKAAEVSVMLASQMEALARELLPGGKKTGAEWMAGSVAGEPGKSWLCICTVQKPVCGKTFRKISVVIRWIWSHIA